jgi:hypothetical protein
MEVNKYKRRGGGSAGRTPSKVSLNHASVPFGLLFSRRHLDRASVLRPARRAADAAVFEATGLERLVGEPVRESADAATADAAPPARAATPLGGGMPARLAFTPSPAAPSIEGPQVRAMLGLQQAYGNRAVSRWLDATPRRAPGQLGAASAPSLSNSPPAPASPPAIQLAALARRHRAGNVAETPSRLPSTHGSAAHLGRAVRHRGVHRQTAGSDAPVANDLDPKNPANYADYGTFARGYQEAEQSSVVEGELRAIWASTHPLQSAAPASTISSQGNTAGSLATTGAFVPITGWQAITSAYQPVDAATGLPLKGPLILYSGDAARAAATGVPPGSGYMIRNTVYYGPADAAEAALRARLGVNPRAFINPAEPYNAIWEPVSRMAVRDATLSGQGVTSMNKIFAVEKLPPGIPTTDPFGLSSSSIQASTELPALRTYGAWMGALGAGGGLLTLYGARQEDQPFMKGLGYVSGGLQVGGGVAYGTGAVVARGELMAAGGLAIETGGVLAIPLLMWQQIKMEAEVQRALQPTVNKMIDEGNYFGAALLSMPPGGYGY